MKTLLINSYDISGAAKACLRLHQGLLTQNFDTKLLLKQNSKSLPNTAQFYPVPKKQSTVQRFEQKLHRLALEFWLVKSKKSPYAYQDDIKNQRPKGLEHFSFIKSPLDVTESPLYQEADIINLHWVADFLDWESFFAKNTKPIIWTLHDQNPFLGGEHYAERFLGIDKKGFPTSRKYTSIELEQQSKILKQKKKILQNVDNLHIVSPSKWLLESSKQSELFSKYPHHHIPYGFPTNIFKPYETKFCREILGVPHDKKVVLFVADSVQNSRKGYIYLKKACENIAKKYQNDVFLCAIGAKSNENTNSSNQLELGTIADERLMAMAYNSADVFVIPSLEDNLPNTMIESILCGTPVIGFDVGGIPDVVKNNETGYICPEISVQSLKETIEKFLDNPDIFDRKQIAKNAKEKYDLKVQTQAYTKLYQQIL